MRIKGGRQRWREREKKANEKCWIKTYFSNALWLVSWFRSIKMNFVMGRFIYGTYICMLGILWKAREHTGHCEQSTKSINELNTSAANHSPFVAQFVFLAIFLFRSLRFLYIYIYINIHITHTDIYVFSTSKNNESIRFLCVCVETRASSSWICRWKWPLVEWNENEYWIQWT